MLRHPECRPGDPFPVKCERCLADPRRECIRTPDINDPICIECLDAGRPCSREWAFGLLEVLAEEEYWEPLYDHASIRSLAYGLPVESWGLSNEATMHAAQAGPRRAAVSCLC